MTCRALPSPGTQQIPAPPAQSRQHLHDEKELQEYRKISREAAQQLNPYKKHLEVWSHLRLATSHPRDAICYSTTSPKSTAVPKAEQGVPPTETWEHPAPPQGTSGHSFCPKTPPAAPSGATGPYRFIGGTWELIQPPGMGMKLKLLCQSSLAMTKEQELSIWEVLQPLFSRKTRPIFSWHWMLLLPILVLSRASNTKVKAICSSPQRDGDIQL